MKIKRAKQQEIRAKLQGIEQALETALTDNFLKENAFTLLSEALDWTQDVQELLR